MSSSRGFSAASRDDTTSIVPYEPPLWSSHALVIVDHSMELTLTQAETPEEEFRSAAHGAHEIEVALGRAKLPPEVRCHTVHPFAHRSRVARKHLHAFACVIVSSRAFSPLPIRFAPRVWGRSGVAIESMVAHRRRYPARASRAVRRRRRLHP